MKPNIINLYTVVDVEKWLQGKDNIYIGRSTRVVQRGSKWGNPYRLRRNSLNSRRKAVQRYKKHIERNQHLADSVYELKGKILGCWCSPSLCHGEVLHNLAGNVPKYQSVDQGHQLKMSQHDHITRQSTGSLNTSKNDSKSKLLTPKSTKKKLSLEDLNAKIDHQNLIIQQLLDEANETKETIETLRKENDEHKKTIASLISSESACTDGVTNSKEAIEVLQARTLDLEGDVGKYEREKLEFQKTISILNESVEKLLVDSVCNVEENTKMADKISRLEERIQKLLDESAVYAEEQKQIETNLKNEYDDRINKVTKKLLRLESAKAYTDSILLVKDKVHELLSKRITHLEQYTRRYSVVVKGIDYRNNEVRDGKLEEDIRALLQESSSTTTYADIDKYHRNGPRFESKQDILIRFKSHSAKENFYRARKSIKRREFKIQPSLSAETKNLLDEAKESVESYEDCELINPPDFVMADLHGNLWLKFKNQTKDDQMFYKFDSIEKLGALIDTHNTNGAIFDDREQDFNRFD